MAEQQGYTKVPNGLLENLAKFPLNGTQFRIIYSVIRYTLGFQRDEHSLSITFLAKSTGITVRTIKKELRHLIYRNILLVTQESTNSTSRVLMINYDYALWIEGSGYSPGEQIDTRGAIHPLKNEQNIPSRGEQIDTSGGEQNIPSEGSNYSPLEGSDYSPKKEILKDNSKENIKEREEEDLEPLSSKPEPIHIDKPAKSMNNIKSILDTWGERGKSLN